MAKRLHMTTADYLAIAISPALIMTLVGSLVFFLIEVFYAGEYEARLDYAFGLFVFATVLIARISIEMGSEQAALYALALGVVMFLFLLRFVEHPSPFSHIINLLLMSLVWWCAHQLTWDSTVIDDDEDASGEGLMQRVGVDGPESNENELLASEPEAKSGLWRWLTQFIRGRKGAHTPGVWVLYFSLAALPLFGVGQHWIPAAEVGRRRYAFFLLLVYVASALTLMVTTSFLNLRRYLRQRRIEMPLPIAGTWVVVGAVLISIVMLLAMLIPRPAAEVALSRVPWQASTPGKLTASRTSVYHDGGEQADDKNNSTAGERMSDDGQGNMSRKDAPTDKSGSSEHADKNSNSDKGNIEANSTKAESGKRQDDGTTTKAKNRSPQDSTKSVDNKTQADQSPQQSQNGQTKPAETQSKSGHQTSKPAAPHSSPLDTIRNFAVSLGGFVGVLKILFYIIVGLLVGYYVWRYRQQILQSLADILRRFRELFGFRAPATGGDGSDEEVARARPRSFSDFQDPFLTGRHSQMPPEELVRHTFAAFEAWAHDHGRPRTPDCTPQELVNVAVEPKTPLHTEARKLVRMYSELAYASRRIPREAADELRDIWHLMRTTSANELNERLAPT